MYICGLGLYAKGALIISDVHIGYEEALNKQGILIPRTQFKEITKSWDRVIQELDGNKISRIIINGDLKHEFGTISETEWRNTLKFLDLIGKTCEKITLIRGNHDTNLGPIARKRNVDIKDSCKVEDILVMHGDSLPENSTGIKAIIIGHEHPAVSLREGARIETFKCFIKGKWKGKEIIVTPSFSPIVQGTDILKEKLLSPFLKKVDDFDVFVAGDKIYEFGKVKNLR
ncbi:metallophosphoesterase [Candidatus Woesearchaeota archaeon]|nr:metallophosphoesterase [Candidatus Woesearchaeota archaeon]